MAQLIQLIDDVVANKFDVPQGSLHLGRHPGSDIQLDDGAVSARHARIIAETNADFPQFREYYLEDLHSTNGTFVNGQKISGRRRLHHNDTLRIAWNEFKFVDHEEQNLDRTVHMLADQ
ncbi:FHA domain-containing protein [Marinimicrobium sp. ABcell2]|uniref:FHA domain-containing protein n=1 Tax=Marinimicrobium sp. ABcell2 TaxID=3069751 RepID=UPI0027ADCCFA|nr:FHA domain-containing protein [Marinimicrobium sp. ABcell2]MDQ2077283.1 FHA domain-containing protein [Marinimicrobium sp. ABcell2]